MKLLFDNSEKLFTVDFDEVAIERVVHRDGINDYLLNGTQVRLKDIVELLAPANIGASGHHIISQGESDRILSTSNRERREMIEDALGLKAYLYKREEAERKLQKSTENIAQVESLRREIAPHLKFLAGQVKKIEETETLREELTLKYLEYLKRESVYLDHERESTASLKEEPIRTRAQIAERIAYLKKKLAHAGTSDAKTKELISLEARLGALGGAREEATRELGRIEGALHAITRQIENTKRRSEGAPAVSFDLVSSFAEKLQGKLSEASDLPSLEEIKARIKSLIAEVGAFLSNIRGSTVHDLRELTEEKETLMAGQERVAKRLEEAKKEEETLLSSVARLRREIEDVKEAGRGAERELFEAMARRGEVETTLATLHSREELLSRAKGEYARELQEGSVLIGRRILEHEQFEVREKDEIVTHAEMVDEEREVQEARRRKIEKMKIRLEEMGSGSSEDIRKEHQEVSERDQFLSREILDLETSEKSLRTLIGELTETLEERFGGGIEKINKQFDAFFKLMFDGGGAELKVTKEKKHSRFAGLEIGGDDVEDEPEEEEIEEGIDISVHLPHKRIKGLNMLSGGERALTSIALIFAMSQVNPPPFLVLDETDAALDEANSRRYGDMIENLAKKSQLILITHNRETMSRAGVLYGVTMDSDGASRLLSVKFEEALAVAK